MLALLRAGLWETPPSGDLFPLSDADWRALHTLAVSHTVVGVVCRGILLLPDHLMPPDALMAKWVAETDRIERRSREMDKAVCTLLQAFRLRGLRPLLLKGQGVARFYAEPSVRQSGDIDLYFPSTEDADKAYAEVRRAGLSPHRAPDGSCCYRWQGVEVEHHPRLFDLQNPLRRGVLRELERGQLSAPLRIGEEGSGEEVLVDVPAPLCNLLLLNAHILKHLVGRGIGLRQFCDMARAYHALRGHYDTEKLKDLYARTGLTAWSGQLHAFLTTHLALPASDLPYLEQTASPSPRLLRLVLEGGNFGRRGSGDESAQPAWRRKWHTLSAFWRNRGFSLEYAPAETFWSMARLVRGNLA